MSSKRTEDVDRNKVIIREYRFPRGTQLAVMVSTLSGFLSFAFPDVQFEPGTVLHEALWSKVPQVSAFLYEWSHVLFGIMVVIHGPEALLMARKTQRHGMSVGSAVFWKWVISAFAEGVGSFVRLDAMVDEKIAKGGRQQ